MARIRDAKPKRSSGGYARVFDDDGLGDLSQKVQSTVISNGTELEKIIVELASKSGILIPNGDLDAFIANAPNGTYLATKRMVRSSKYAVRRHEPDFIIFKLSPAERMCYVVELKEGAVFDTKKAKGEKAQLEEFQSKFATETPFVVRIYICSFNSEDKGDIVSGFKGEFSVDEVMTGRMFCELLGFDYDAILEQRKSDAPDNVKFYVGELLKIPVVVTHLSDVRRKHVNPDEFYEREEV